MEPRLRQMRESGESRRKALRLRDCGSKGLLRHASKHAAGIVIGSRPLVEDLPLFVDKEGAVMTQFSGPNIDEIGLIKFDFLGLKTLTLLSNIVRRIEQGRGSRKSTSRHCRLDDKKTYRLMSKGDTVGVFQMESSGMRKLLAQLAAREFRGRHRHSRPVPPGSARQRHGRRVHQAQARQKGSFSTCIRSWNRFWSHTYGVIVYQEQVMQIAQALAGYSLGDADNLRRAMGKKDAEKMKKERQRFVDGAEKKRVHRREAGGRDLRSNGDVRDVRLQ